MKRCGKFHFGHRGLETSKTSKYVPKKLILAGNKRLLPMREEGAATGLEGSALGANLEGWGVS